MAGRVLLVSAPWRLAGWPSLALGTLQAYLRERQIEVTALHLHLEVAARLGLERYQDIASGWEIPEAIYFALYAREEAEQILRRCNVAMPSALVAEVEAITNEALGSIDPQQYDVVGFSVGALQLGASIHLSRWFKRHKPSVKIVFGGSAVVGEVGKRLLEHLPWVDALVDGEGEAALAELAGQDHWTPTFLRDVPNLWFRAADGGIARSSKSSVASLDRIPTPDFTDYFTAARTFGLNSYDFLLPIEGSRGCQWEHRKNDGKLRGCSFCGLYRGSPNFREHRLEGLMERIRAGVSSSGCVHLGFVDAYLPSAYAKQLLRELSQQPADLTFFCEMRCDLDEETARLLAQAGALHIQFGVEAFDTRILARMSKGMRMIDNVFSLKLCEEFGVPYQYNLITNFPGTSLESLQDTLELLPSLWGYRPPLLAKFYLDRGSRMHAEPAKYEIDPDSLDREGPPFLPAALRDAKVSQVVSFATQASAPIESAWAEIERSVAEWATLHRRASTGGFRQLLTWRDSGEVLTIVDLRGGTTLSFEIDGLLRQVLLACDRLVRRSTVLKAVSDLDAESLEHILERLRDLRLVVIEGQWVLGLPVRARLPSGAFHPHRRPTTAADVALTLV